MWGEKSKRLRQRWNFAIICLLVCLLSPLHPITETKFVFNFSYIVRFINLSQWWIIITLSISLFPELLFLINFFPKIFVSTLNLFFVIYSMNFKCSYFSGENWNTSEIKFNQHLIRFWSHRRQHARILFDEFYAQFLWLKTFPISLASESIIQRFALPFFVCQEFCLDFLHKQQD